MRDRMKDVVNGLSILAVLPAAALLAFGRWGRMFSVFAQAFAVGNPARVIRQV